MHIKSNLSTLLLALVWPFEHGIEPAQMIVDSISLLIFRSLWARSLVNVARGT